MNWALEGPDPSLGPWVNAECHVVNGHANHNLTVRGTINCVQVNEDKRRILNRRERSCSHYALSLYSTYYQCQRRSKKTVKLYL